MAYSATLTGSGWNVGPITPTKPPYVPGPGYAKTLTGSGWVVNPIPDPNNPATVIAAKAAALAAPAVGALQYQAQTVSYLGANAFPDLSFDRHYTSGAGFGTADFFTKVKAFYHPTSWESLGGPTNGENDGSAAAFWTAWKSSMGTVQNTNPVTIAFQTPSQRIWLPSQAGRVAQLRVDGKLLPAGSPIAWPSNNNMAKVDFGSAGAGAGRKIVVQGQAFPNLWLSEVAVDAGSPIIPYDWHADTGRVPAAYLGDSYGIINPDYSLVGLPFVPYLAELCGFGALTQSSIGGTGYNTNGGSVDYPNALDTNRLDVVTRESPTVIVVALGVNDPGDASTVSAMQTLYAALRTRCPQALIVAVPPWAPGQTAGANPGGKYQAMRTALYSTLAGVAGPWIIVDNLAGRWATSKGTNSGAGTGPWLTGDGNAGAPTGSGNADTYMSADVPHLTAAGNKAFPELFAALYKPALASM